MAMGRGLFQICPISERERGVTAELANRSEGLALHTARSPLPFPELRHFSEISPAVRNRFCREPPGARGERELSALRAGMESGMEPGWSQDPPASSAGARAGAGDAERGQNLSDTSLLTLGWKQDT